jgi:hypothetical protein
MLEQDRNRLVRPETGIARIFSGFLIQGTPPAITDEGTTGKDLPYPAHGRAEGVK